MRSQAAKPLTKKGALGNTSFKATKQVKKRAVAPKKVKASPKSALKGLKKVSGDNAASSKNDGDSSGNEKNDTNSEAAKVGSSKPIVSRENSPSKKSKKESKETKDKAKVLPKKVVSKRPVKLTKKNKPSPKLKVDKKDSDVVKYKINVEAIKKGPIKTPKSKSNSKKGNISQKKKGPKESKEDNQSIGHQEENENIDKTEKIIKENVHDSNKVEENPCLLNETKNEKKEEKISIEKPQSKVTEPPTENIATIMSKNQAETPKVEVERPPKFFTSTRSPRTVDIDVKCCKNSKGNLSVSERFLSMKCESKSDDTSKEKSSSSNLISQGPEIDVYTFTEKVDSPKSILSDFRSPINKNVGRVRPIARVKGTIIDKKTDSERKKYSPHRPIEEVVKQLKAIKRSEDIIISQTNYEPSGLDFGMFSDEKEVEDKPPIVSKSYKMVARKSSITGQPFSPIKFPDQEEPAKKENKAQGKILNTKKNANKAKKLQKKSISDEEINTSTFSLNTKTFHYTSSEESVSESNDDNDSKDSSESENFKNKRTKNKKYKRITDSAKKNTSKELKELSKDSLIDLKDTSALLGNEKPSKRRLKLLSMWSGPKKHRMASLNALAKVHCLYENESRTHMELGLMKTVDRQVIPSTSKVNLCPKKKENKLRDSEKQESTSESEYENKREKEKDSSDSSDDSVPQRTLRGVPGIRSAGKYWDPKSSTSSSEDSELEFKTKKSTPDKKKVTSKSSSNKSDSDKPPPKMKKTAGVPVKKKRNRNEVVMDLKDMVVQKRMASLNATAILAASYEKRSPKSSKDDTTSDSCSDESFSQKPKNLLSSGVKSELKNEEPEKESDDALIADKKQKVEVIVNQDTDVTITGVYSTHHHEGFCTVSGMQYRISSTSHTQTTATANCEKEGCSREDGSRYTPLSALSSMQPPAEHAHTHPHPVPELGGLSRRPGCSSAFSAPSPAAHHDPGYYQPAGPLIKESGADAERALARYHPPHYHAPHPPVLQQYGPYYPAELCYGRYYRPPGPYHLPPPQPEPQMVSVGSEPYPPPYYGTPPCYQHSPQRIPYVEYRGCPCPLNACPKNVLIGPATGKAPAGGGPDVPSAPAPPGAAFRAKVRACAPDSAADNHGSGKDPPLEPEPPEPPMAADAPHPCPLPAIGGASPKREMYDVRENMRLTGDVPGPIEALGPPSPARGACAPQPPPSAPRLARLGKAMARRTLAGDDTSSLISTPQSTVVSQDADDDVLAISPPVCAPIDLSSSDERSTPLVDVKKENEGPTYAASRKTDAQALREHNSTTALTDALDSTDAAKAVKRRYSKPKLEIEMKDVQLEDACKTNGIGEHVKLQKRRKVSGDQTNVPRIETITKEPKRKSPHKRLQKTSSGDKKAHKRKSDTIHIEPKTKKVKVINDDPRLTNVAAGPGDEFCIKPKTKSALLLDDLLKRNSIDRPDTKGYSPDTKLNPAELFLSPNENVSQNCTKKTLNINNNVVENNVPVNGVQPKTIAAVSQLIGKKLANKNACKLEKVDSKITHNLKSVLSTPTEALKVKEVKHAPLMNGETKVEKGDLNVPVDDEKSKLIAVKEKCEPKGISVSDKESIAVDAIKPVKANKLLKMKTLSNQSEIIPKSVGNVDESQSALSNECKLTHSAKPSEKFEDNTSLDKSLPKRSKLYNIDKTIGEFKSKNVENLVKLLTSKKVASKATELLAPVQQKDVESIKEKDIITPLCELTGRCKLTGEKASGKAKSKNVEKVVKLLVSKKTVIKTDEASLVVEDACSSPVPSLRKTRRRRSGGRRMRRVAAPLTPPDLQPRAQPKWSNGWNWDGEHYISKVYLNNDSRLDRTARCWPRMSHASGDRVARGDCVLLRASLKPAHEAQPYVARVASLWEDPDNGEMMVSLVWYYRPEHTERGRQAADAPDEVFASRHRDANSVACIEDKCYVLTFNEYCRYKKRLKAAEEGITIGPSIVPPLPASEVTPAIAPNDTKLPPSVSPELVLFCRKIYDFRSKKIHVPNK